MNRLGREQPYKTSYFQMAAKVEPDKIAVAYPYSPRSTDELLDDFLKYEGTVRTFIRAVILSRIERGCKT